MKTRRRIADEDVKIILADPVLKSLYGEIQT